MKRFMSMILCVAMLFMAAFPVELAKMRAEAAEGDYEKEAVYDATVSHKQTYTTSKRGFMIPIQIKRAGIASVRLALSGNSGESPVALLKREIDPANADFWKDYHWNRQIGKDGTVRWNTHAEGPMTAYLYVRRTSEDFNGGTEATLTLETNFYDATYGREIKPGEKAVINQIRDDEYWKITLKKSGILYVNLTNRWVPERESFYLCNAAKKEISGAVEGQPLYLEKGNYYIHTNLVSGLKTLSYTVKPIKMQKGKNTKMKKAKKIAFGKKVGSFFPCTAKAKSHYYKFTVKKKRNLTLKYDMSNKYIVSHFWIFQKKGNKWYLFETDKKKGTLTRADLPRKKIKLSKGICYVVVDSMTEYYGGTYSFTLK